MGASTTTYDVEGDITSSSKSIPSITMVNSAINQYQGEILQTPPPFSAKKLNGKKYYEYAREGTFILPPPEKRTLEITLDNYKFPYLQLTVLCSSGTYIRSLAHDLGNTLGCGGYIEALRRTKSGNFTLDDCHLIDELKQFPETIQYKLLTQDLIT